MADNTIKIAELESILNSGIRTTTVDGLTVQYDFAEIRKRISELKSENDATLNKRRMFTTIRTPWN